MAALITLHKHTEPLTALSPAAVAIAKVFGIELESSEPENQVEAIYLDVTKDFVGLQTVNHAGISRVYTYQGDQLMWAIETTVKLLGLEHHKGITEITLVIKVGELAELNVSFEPNVLAVPDDLPSIPLV